MTTLAALAGFAVVMAREADHEARSLRSQRSLRSPAVIESAARRVETHR